MQPRHQDGNTDPKRVDRPLGAYGHIGDGRAHALISDQGSIDWLALPEDADLVVFDALLDAADGGRFQIEPAGAYESWQRYIDGSMVLQTTFETDEGTLVLTDCLTLHNGAMLPWVELARLLHCERGAVDVHWTVEPSLVLGRTPTAFRHRRDYLMAEPPSDTGDNIRLGLQHWDMGDTALAPRGATGQHRLASGDEALFAAVIVVDEPLPRPDRHEVSGRIQRSIEAWRGWDDSIDYSGRWDVQVRQSARVLKLLTHEPDGAIMAAPTTSLPERIGGPRNFDYRYCWVRDASFTIDSLLRIGLVEEAHRAIAALLRMSHSTAPHLAPFYEIGGGVPDRSERIDLAGYRGSRPVRSGNSAVDQLQLGNWGDLFEALWIYVRQGNELDARTADLMRRLADHVCDIWRREDSGMWELPQRRHYTISKMGCWVALDRALRMVDADQLDGDTDRWTAIQHDIRSFVYERCWSDRHGSFTFHADTEAFDAATLLASRLGFVDGDAEEMAATISAIQEELCEDHFVWRYSGQRRRENAFLPCSFWLAEALARAGLFDDAARQMDGALGAMTPLGLLSEEYDLARQELRGNFPQGLSHLALVGAASFYTEAVERPG